MPRFTRAFGTGGRAHRAPGWVKVFGVIAILVVVLLLDRLLTGGPGGTAHSVTSASVATMAR